VIVRCPAAVPQPSPAPITAPSIESPVNFVLSALTEPVPVVEAVPRTETTSARSRLMLRKVPSAHVMRVVEGSL